MAKLRGEETTSSLRGEKKDIPMVQGRRGRGAATRAMASKEQGRTGEKKGR